MFVAIQQNILEEAMAKRKDGVKFNKVRNNNKFRIFAVVLILLSALVVAVLAQISPKAAFAFVGFAILSPIAGMMYFFNRLGK